MSSNRLIKESDFAIAYLNLPLTIEAEGLPFTIDTFEYFIYEGDN